MRKFHIIALTMTAISALALGGCSIDSELKRLESASRIAAPAHLIKREISSAPFILTTFERMNERGTTANIYIEGDGQAWISRKVPSLNPTPKDPVALRLSTKDTAKNVAYIARPCQYSAMLDKNTSCPMEYWLEKRFAPEVIQAYSIALDNIANTYDISGFNLIGFSGGASVVALLAAKRSDVLSLRTVAGNIDHKAHSAYHNISMLTGSLNPTDYTERLSNIPQRHFIGEQDTNITQQVSQSYINALPTTACVSSQIVKGATHTDGWEEQWASLLQEPISCYSSTK